jgi:hypothetical protein
MSETNQPYAGETCSASRHVLAIAGDLARDGHCQHIVDEPAHCAESMRATVEALWAARREARAMVQPDIAEVERLVRDYCNACRAIAAERDGLMQTLRDEIDENLRLRELGGAMPDENITAMTERLIRERDQFRDAAKMVSAAPQPIGEVPMPEPAATFYTDEQTGRFSEYMRPPAKLTEGDARLYDGPAMHAYGNACRAAGYARGLATAGKDAERLDWMIQHTDAAICSAGPNGPFHIWFRYSNRLTEEYPTARAAIDAALRGEVKP